MLHSVLCYIFYIHFFGYISKEEQLHAEMENCENKYIFFPYNIMH